MKRLNMQITLLSFFVLMHVGIIQGMELSLHDEMPRDVYIQSMARNVQKTGVISDLAYFPTDWAIDIVTSTSSDWRAIDENRIKLIEFAKWRMDVMCAAVEKINDIGLAHGLAKQGKITHGVASVIVNDFLKTDITECVSDFYGLFHTVFPEEILAYGNYNIVYKVLMDAMTKDSWYATNNITNKNLFFKNDFDMDLPLEEVGMYIKLPAYKNQLKCATVDIGRNFLVAGYDKHYVRIYDLKMGNTLGFVIPIEVKKFVLKKDNLGLLGILDTDDKIHEFAMPLELLRAKISLQQIAALVYSKVHAYKKTTESMDCMGHALFESQNCDEERKLKSFIQKRLQWKWIPPYLMTTLRVDSEHLDEVAVLRKIFDDMAKTLEVTRKQVAIDLYVNHTDKAWSAFDEKCPDLPTRHCVHMFADTFIKKLHES